MFLNKIKEYWIKKSVKKRLSNIKHTNSDNSIKKIGILIDQSRFNEIYKLVAEFQKYGFQKNDIELLIFKDKINTKETINFSEFCANDLNWNETFDKEEVNHFINSNFDLLISYYDVEKAPLLITTLNSKAHFKVGFSSVDLRLNQFMIATNIENYKIFVTELFKYLNILNKL